MDILCVSQTLSLYLTMISLVFRTARSNQYDSTDYCALTCKWPTPNAACNCTPASYCDDLLGAEKDLKKFRIWMVEIHNELRNRVALGKEWEAGLSVGVANMHTLDFDEELEHMARCFAMKCQYILKEPPCLRTTRFNESGLNRLRLAVDRMEEQFVKDGVKQWYEEVRYIDKYLMDKLAIAYIPLRNSREFFTQLAWARSTHIGCWKSWHDMNDIALLYCVYGPSGNIVHEPMLVKGKACTQCGEERCNMLFRGLCGEITLKGVRGVSGSDLQGRRAGWTVWIGFGILQLIKILRLRIVFF